MVIEDAPRGINAEDGVIETIITPKNESVVDASFERIINNIAEAHHKEVRTVAQEPGHLVEIYSRDKEPNEDIVRAEDYFEKQRTEVREVVKDDSHLEHRDRPKHIKKIELAKSKEEEQVLKVQADKELNKKTTIKVPAKISEESKRRSKYDTARSLIKARLQISRNRNRTNEQTRYIELKTNELPYKETQLPNETRSIPLVESSKSDMAKYEVNKSTSEQASPEIKNALNNHEDNPEALGDTYDNFDIAKVSAPPLSIGDILGKKNHFITNELSISPTQTQQKYPFITLVQLFKTYKLSILIGFVIGALVFILCLSSLLIYR